MDVSFSSVSRFNAFRSLLDLVFDQGKSLLLELCEDRLELVDPQNYCVLTVQPIRLIRLWAVSRNHDR